MIARALMPASPEPRTRCRPERVFVVEDGATLAGRAIAPDGFQTALVPFDPDEIAVTRRWPVEGCNVRVIVDRLSGARLRSLVACLLSAGAATVRAIRVSGNRVEIVPGIDWLAGGVR